MSVCKGWRSSPPASPWSGSLTTLRLSSGALFLSHLKIVLWYKSLPFLSRALDAGACGIVAPMINNREDAQRLVDQCRYLPPICTYLYLLSCMYLAPRAYIAGDTYLNASPHPQVRSSRQAFLGPDKSPCWRYHPTAGQQLCQGEIIPFSIFSLPSTKSVTGVCHDRDQGSHSEP